MNIPVQALGWTLIHFLWQGSALAVLVALGLWALEGRDSRLRYTVACAGLSLMMAAPPLTFLRLSAPAQAVWRAPLGSKTAAPIVTQSRSVDATKGSAWAGALERALPRVVLLWVLGSLAMSLRLAGGWVWLQWLRRRPDTQPAADAQQLQLLRLCQRMGVGSNLRLLLCRSVPGPTVLGWIRPVILIPPAMVLGLSPHQLELILAHELAHVLRHDYLVNLLQSLAEVLLFFHPAVWWLSKQIRQEREQASDDLAVRLCGDALDFAQALTALEALASRGHANHPVPRLALGAQGGTFMSRIHRLISPMAPSMLAPRAGLVVLMLMGGAYGLHARHQAPKPAVAEAESPLPKGTVSLRRFDADSADGHAKAGTIDMRAHACTQASIEAALAKLQTLPGNPATGYVELVTMSKASDTDSLWTYKFTGVDPARVVTIIRAQAAQASIEKKPGLLTVLRLNAFSYQGGFLPKGLRVEVWAGDVPAAMVLQALNELEAMTPLAGVPQAVRKECSPGVGKGPTIRLDVSGADPVAIRALLEKTLAGAARP